MRIGGLCGYLTFMRKMYFKPKAEKFGNDISSLCALGHSHASKLETAVCQMIQLREKAGEIKLVQIQCKVYLTRANLGYIPDFKCVDNTGQIQFWEAKGFEDQLWPWKKK